MNRLVPGVLLAGGWLALLFYGSATLFWVVVGDKAAVMPQLAKLGLPVETAPSMTNDSEGGPKPAPQPERK